MLALIYFAALSSNIASNPQPPGATEQIVMQPPNTAANPNASVPPAQALPANPPPQQPLPAVPAPYDYNKTPAQVSPRDTYGTPGDLQIVINIRKLLNLPPNNDLAINVSAGVVTLQGTVDTQDQVQAIEAAVRSIQGVKTIYNHLRAKNVIQNPNDSYTNANDKIILTAIRSQLPPQYDGIAINVSNGIVNMQGMVGSKQEVQYALQIALNAPGIKSINNQLQYPLIKTGQVAAQDSFKTAEDRQILVEIRSRLNAGRYDNIAINVNHGAVTLSGIVNTDDDSKDATRRAVTVEGVTSVNNQLTIYNYSSSHQISLNDNFLTPTDRLIVIQIRKAYMNFPSNRYGDVSINVINGTVTLQGVVTTEHDANIAVKIASEANSVQAVNNQIQVIAR